MMDAADSSALRAEHDLLMARLSTRKSTEHFARAAVVSFVALIVCGAAGKFFWDSSHKYGHWALGIGAVGLVLLGYAASRYLRGRALLAGELREFERLSALRRSLGIDDPATLLPR